MVRFGKIAGLLAGLLAALCMAPIALAHAHYVTSAPAQNATVATAPASVTITYDDDLDPNATTVTVLGPSGQTVSTGKTTVKVATPKVASVAINGAGNGAYTVNWHAVADDDKGVTEGSFTFRVGSASTTATNAAAQSTQTAGTSAAPSTLPSSGGGGMAMRSEQLQAGASLAAALLVALLTLTAGARSRAGR